jgi:hypothetical protein
MHVINHHHIIKFDVLCFFIIIDCCVICAEFELFSGFNFSYLIVYTKFSQFDAENALYLEPFIMYLI